MRVDEARVRDVDVVGHGHQNGLALGVRDGHVLDDGVVGAEHEDAGLAVRVLDRRIDGEDGLAGSVGALVDDQVLEGHVGRTDGGEELVVVVVLTTDERASRPTDDERVRGVLNAQLASGSARTDQAALDLDHVGAAGLHRCAADEQRRRCRRRARRDVE